MMKNKKHTKISSGALTEQMDTTNQEFDQFQAILLDRIQTQRVQQKQDIALAALQFEMEDLMQKHL